MTMKNKSKSSLPGIVILTVLLIFSAVTAGFYFSLSPVSKSEDSVLQRFSVPSGVGVKTVAESLSACGLIRSKNAFYLAVRYPFVIFRSEKPVLKSGIYTLSSSMSAGEIISVLDSGKQAFIKTVVPEGLTMRKIALLLEEDEVCKAGEFLDCCHSPELLEKYGIHAESFEGFLFPDTYFFTPSMNAEAVVCIMADNFFAHLKSINGYEGAPDDYFNTLVLASIVEREYQSADEAPLIASVFKNRIKSGAGLYSCATIEYIITEILGRAHPDVITYDDLKIDSPYNTYKWAALPPGPISNPGVVALSAAANAPETDYYFFVLKGDGSGTHRFTKSQSEHEAAIIQYRTKKAAGSK